MEEKIEKIKKVKDEIELTIETDDVMTYAIQQNGGEIVRDICIKNMTEYDISDLVVHVDSDTQLIELFEIGIQKLRAKEEVHLKGLKIKINGEYLASLTERVSCNLRFCVYYEDELLIVKQKEIVALAFDQWPGLRYTPELLVAFSIPNHPVITNLVQLAAQYMEKWTEDPSLAGYQFNDSNRVKQMAAAIQQKKYNLC